MLGKTRRAALGNIDQRDLRGAAANVEQHDCVGLALDQRTAARYRKARFGLAIDDLKLETGLFLHPAKELLAVRLPGGRLQWR